MTLRSRLAAVAVVGVLVPLAVLVVVAFASSEETSVSSGSSGELVERTRALSPWVPLTAAALALPVALVAWWWAGRAVDELQSATQAKDRLVEDASHQLRTPVAVVATTIDVALADPSADLRAALADARDGVRRIESVVDGLLADARAARREHDLVAVVRAATTLPFRGPDRLVVACDGPAVQRAVEALVENAVAHASDRSAVGVEVGVDAATGLGFVAVTDDGPGIPPEQLDRVFERYWSDRADGLGIGLAVVKQVGEAHEGVTATSPVTDGHGTRFTLHFRRDPAPPSF